MSTADNKRDFKFTERTSVYDEKFEGKFSEKIYRLVTETITLSPNDKILDIGCGTGTILKRLSDKCNIDGYGIDIEEEMIQQAKQKCPQMQIFKCDCTNTPFEDETFDSITACMAFHHFHDQNAFAREASRILKAGGKFYLADPGLPGIPRTVINTVINVHNLVGKFNTIQEIEQIFKPYGLIKKEVLKDGLFQLIILEKVSE